MFLVNKTEETVVKLLFPFATEYFFTLYPPVANGGILILVIFFGIFTVVIEFSPTTVCLVYLIDVTVLPPSFEGKV